MSRDCCVALPCDAMGLSAVCDCDISKSYSLFLILQKHGPQGAWLIMVTKTLKFSSEIDGQSSNNLAEMITR